MLGKGRADWSIKFDRDLDGGKLSLRECGPSALISRQETQDEVLRQAWIAMNYC